MRVAVTLIDRIVSSAVTDDGRHAVLRLADIDGHEVALGIPSEQILELINASARALTDSERMQGHGMVPAARTEVTWWTLHADETSEQLLLSLTFPAGARLCFVLPCEMALALSNDLAARLRKREAEQPGFGAFTR